MTIFLVQTGSANFSSAREAMKSPLALKLFQVDGVTGVFFGSDFITVTKSDQYAWSLLKPEIFAAIMEHFTAGTAEPRKKCVSLRCAMLTATWTWGAV